MTLRSLGWDVLGRQLVPVIIDVVHSGEVINELTLTVGKFHYHERVGMFPLHLCKKQ